ncbi:MAG: altronate dehydratase [Elusimicrobiaceae bacterium]|nr:altronate dehydratase [Elusimicrobiaceae bacterium]
MAEQLVIRITDRDNVAVALQPLQAGQTVTVSGQDIVLKNDIPFGHKIALQDFQPNENIIKYGQPIGHAKVAIARGEHIHTHNLKTNLDGLLDYTYQPQEKPAAQTAKHAEASFMGYVRTDGQVGIRNEIWIIPTVGCVNTTAQRLAKAASEKLKGLVDGVYAYTHNMGCSQLGADHRRTQDILKGLIRHPNAAGVLVLSLGCENNNLDNFKPVLGDIDPKRVKFLVTQDVNDEYGAGMKILDELAAYAQTFKREPVPASKLVLGFKCGGSDAFSGITANPLCGRINDLLVSLGGTTILTEVPEMFGAETLLMKRAVSKEVFEKTVHLINDFKSYFTRYGQTIYENPSPGNKKGGISSLEEKSLGCTQKGGHAPVVDVLNYGEQAVKNGLNLLIGPGNDQVSCTNLVASGAQIVLFTTGRGNPFGSPVPTIKIATNTGLYTRKPHWIDFNAGQILDGMSFEQATEALFHYVLDIASGRVQTNNEKFGYKEISVFRDGVIL